MQLACEFIRSFFTCLVILNVNRCFVSAAMALLMTRGSSIRLLLFLCSTLLVLAKDKMGSRVLETVLNHSDEASFERLRVAFSDDQEKLIQLASHPVANFVVQKLLSASRMKNTVCVVSNSRRELSTHGQCSLPFVDVRVNACFMPAKSQTGKNGSP